jgi:hypothetical protein
VRIASPPSASSRPSSSTRTPRSRLGSRDPAGPGSRELSVAGGSADQAVTAVCERHQRFSSRAGFGSPCDLTERVTADGFRELPFARGGGASGWLEITLRKREWDFNGFSKNGSPNPRPLPTEEQWHMLWPIGGVELRTAWRGAGPPSQLRAGAERCTSSTRQPDVLGP